MKFLAIVAFVALAGLATAAPTYDLQGDLHEFVELIPVEEMRAVARKYIENDAEVQKALAYLKGEEWAKLVDAVKNHPTWQGFKEYLTEAGIDIEAIIQFIHDLIAGAGGRSTRAVSTRSMREFVDELLALLPTEELISLLNDKLQNSADFQEFWTKISSEKSYAMVEEIRALPEVQRVADELRKMHIDIDKVLQIVYELFGWEV